MSASTDAMYNASSRYIHLMLKIHFSDTEILEVTRENFLITASILEESYKESDSPFGEVTSNELTVTLYNEDGLFNPSNTSGRYYGKIRKGIKIEVLIKPDEVDEWDPLGVYYVTDWYTNSSGMGAEVTANDLLYNVLNGPVVPLPVYRNADFSTFITMYFNKLGYAVSVDPEIEYTIPYAYASSYAKNKDFLAEILKGVMADCFCDHTGVIKISSKNKARAARATFTDNDQIIDVSIKQSISTGYDSVVVTCRKGQESDEQPLVNISEVDVTPGYTDTGKVTLTSYPALSIRSVKATSDKAVKVVSFSATAKECSVRLQSAAVSSAEVSVIGTKLDSVEVHVGEAKNLPLTISSNFIQDEQIAEEIRQYSSNYITARVPLLELNIRGNPRINLGSLIVVSSTRFKVTYVGLLIKASYEYTGSLTSKVTLVDATMLQEV